MKTFATGLLLLILLPGCTAFKAMKCGSPKPSTFRNFPLDTIHAPAEAQSQFIVSPDHDRFYEETRFTGSGLEDETVGDYFARVRGDGALLIVRNDTILLERYYGSFSPLSPANAFSVTKAVTSLLCGIAADEGRLSLSDPVTRYIPELEKADTLFRSLTVEHLLDMRTGLDFDENYGWNPFSAMAMLYYGGNVEGQFARLRFREPPGRSHHYNSMSTALLGVVLERAVGMPYARYLEEKVWQPMGMEADAFVSLDDSRHRRAKAYGGLATNVRDLAKIGRLYISGGVWNGKRIVGKEWIDRSVRASADNEAYSLGWNNITTLAGGKTAVTPRFFAIGLYGQVLFCDPERNLIFVTVGEKKGGEYQLIFDSLSSFTPSGGR